MHRFSRGGGPRLPDGIRTSLWLLLGLSLSSSLAFAQPLREELKTNFLTNGREVRRAFRDVVNVPRNWTVQVISGEFKVGLGTIISEDGFILTKASQIKGATAIQLNDLTSHPFEVKGYHRGHDLVLVKINLDHKLSPAVWEGEDPHLGQWMITVGTTSDPVAVGVMSAKRHGIPRLTHGALGIQLDGDPMQAEHPRIQTVYDDSAAFAAGLKAGDVVLQANGNSMESVLQLQQLIRTYRPGDTVSLKIRRDAEELAYDVTLGYPSGEVSRMTIQNEMGGELSLRRDEFESVFQHDTVLAPENCGGPVVNLDGKAVGINIARAGRTETYVLPANLLAGVVEDMKSGKYPAPGNLLEGERVGARRQPVNRRGNGPPSPERR